MSSRFDIIATLLQGLVTLVRKPIGDDRGYLDRVFCEADLEELLLGRRIVQVNRTLTERAGSVRGMHYQRPPGAETKIVSCLHGAVFDVAIDLRTGSPTFLKWHGEVLSEENRRTLLIPEGFAHGLQTLCDNVEMLYLHTASYDAYLEDGVNALDPLVGIDWQLDITERSARDQNLPLKTKDFKGVAV